MALVGVVYSISQSRLRRWIIPDNDAQLQDPRLLMSGEAILTYDASLGTSIDVLNEQVRLVTGKPASDDYCAVVDKDGAILAVVKGDPSIDTHPDGDLVDTKGNISPLATYDAEKQQFSAVIPEKTIKAGTKLKDGTVTEADATIPPRMIVRDVSETATVGVEFVVGIRP